MEIDAYTRLFRARNLIGKQRKGTPWIFRNLPAGGNQAPAVFRIRWDIAFAAMGDNGSITSVLHQTAEQFQILVDSVEEYAIYLLDPNGAVVTWNTGAQKIKGYMPEEIIGKNFTCFYAAEDVAAGKPKRNLREAARRGHIRDQGPRVRKDGSTFEAEVILTALRNDNEIRVGY